MKLYPVHQGSWQNNRDRPHNQLCPHSVPWAMLEPHEQQAQSNHSQTLTVLASRGGLGIEEIYLILRDEKYRGQGTLPSQTKALVYVLRAIAEFLDTTSLSSYRERMNYG